MRYQFTNQARDDLKGIADYTLNTFGNAQAHRYLDAIEAACNALTTTPCKGPPRDNLIPGLRSLPCQSHVLFYTVSDSVITIIRVLHKHMDAGNRLRE
ncbi:plasmid stabilization system [Alcanivorax hongdengensis A-11-3]|uniref:Toxin n=1 Tax=Alcanivorax hongdengensis A-11-3 TaxID=1177179 RepID=L0WAP2_9GAMM|nr:plasmid stabilization system [Alcanivorax hongdengensis A-11-3]